MHQDPAYPASTNVAPKVRIRHSSNAGGRQILDSIKAGEVGATDQTLESKQFDRELGHQVLEWTSSGGVVLAATR